MEWIAYYNDGTTFYQFGDNGKENLFSDVDQDKLKVFTIKDLQSQISINLKTGIFDFNDNEIQIDGFSNRKEKYELIYFRRVRSTIGTKNESINNQIIYFIGYQIIIDNKKYKVLFGKDKEKYHIKIA